MIPKFRIPEITEFMLGITVSNYTSQDTQMNVFIPALMLDKTPNNTENNIALNNSLFVSKENIRASTTIRDLNYITVKVSEHFRKTYSDISSVTLIGEGPSTNINYEYTNFPKGSKVRIFIPDFALSNAVIVPLI